MEPLPVLEMEVVKLGLELAPSQQRIEEIADRVAVLEERLVASTRRVGGLSDLLADQGEMVLTVKTVASGTRGEVDRLNYGVSKAEGAVLVLEAKQDHLDALTRQLKARVEELEGKRLNGIHGTAIVGAALGVLFLIGGLNIATRQGELGTTNAALAQKVATQDNQLQLLSNELAKARAQQRVDAQYLVNELAKKRSK
jgi:outer membrane murein-binding lipoprotein Lpp